MFLSYAVFRIDDFNKSPKETASIMDEGAQRARKNKAIMRWKQVLIDRLHTIARVDFKRQFVL